MSEARLAIPLTENKTRQNMWRVLRFCLPLGLAALIAFVMHQTWVTRDTLSAWWPSNATMAIRLMKTASTAELIDDNFHGLTLLTNAPFSLSDLNAWSNREMIIFLDENGPVAIGTDAPLDPAIVSEAAQFGMKTATHGSTSLLYSGDTPSYFRRLSRFSPWLLWPDFNGEMLTNRGGRLSALPLRVDQHSLTIHGFEREADVSMMGIPTDTTILAAFDVSSAEVSQFTPQNVPLVYPGTNALFAEINQHGVSGVLGTDARGLVYTLTIRESTMAESNIESLVKEGFLLISAQTSDELHGATNIVVHTSSDNGVTITTAKDQNGNVVRATQTPHSLVISNRNINIDTSIAPRTDTCLKGVGEFIRPKDLKNFLPDAELPFSASLSTLFTQIEEIAVNKNTVKICW